jgi:hypothetical protein
MTREPMIALLAADCGVKQPTALGLWVNTLLGFAEYQPDGRADLVLDAALEHWAGWPGKVGRYAAAFRARCVEEGGWLRRYEDCLVTEVDGDPDADPDGMRRRKMTAARVRMHRFRRDQALQSALPTALPTALPIEPNALPTALPKALRNADGNALSAVVVVNQEELNHQNKNNSNSLQKIPEPLRWAVLCTKACNIGLRDAGLPYNELIASNQDAPQAWHQDGVALDVALRTVYNCARKYRPSGRRKQPSSLRYFDAAVRDAWERHQAAAMAPDGDLAAAVAGADETEGERLARELLQEVRP